MRDSLGRVEAGTLIVSRPEIVQIRQELSNLEEVLVTLRQNNASLAAISKIQAEVANVTILLNEPEAQENTDTSGLLETTEDLKSRLEECKNSEVTTALYDLWDQPGKRGYVLPAGVSISSVHGQRCVRYLQILVS